MIVESSKILLEKIYSLEEDWDEWPFDLLDDCDIITLLYSDLYLTPDTETIGNGEK